MFKKIKNLWDNTPTDKPETIDDSRERTSDALNANVTEGSHEKTYEDLVQEAAKRLKDKPYTSWRSQVTYRGWNLNFAKITENQIPIPDTSKPVEQDIILEHNSKLNELKAEAAKISERWNYNKIETLLEELVEITARLVAVVDENLETRKILSFYQILAGLAAKEMERSTKFIQEAIIVMESIIREFPEHLTDPAESDFRSDVSQAYFVLEQSDPKNAGSHNVKSKDFESNRPKNERGELDHGIKQAYLWTEARIQLTAKLRSEGVHFLKSDL